MQLLLTVCSNADESEKMKQEIQREEDRRQKLDMQVQKVTDQICDISSVLRSFCAKLQVSIYNINIRIKC
jgi:septal ring factor EnvC (AmiA/AmiB activator)